MNNEIHYGRKRNGIKRQLKVKLQDWLDSIEDEELRKAAAKDCIVTGGAIASMLMGDKVNDYDIYFTTKETAKKVAQYYVDKFNAAKKSNDVVNYAPRINETTITNIKSEKEDVIQIWMQSAGVAAEDQEPYDYFEARTEEETAKFAESLITEVADTTKPRYRPVFMSQNAITLSDKIQIVIRFTGEPEEIHKNYDYIHATCWYRYNTNELVTSVPALEAMMSRTLVYTGSLYPIASVFRAKKFIERGWRITAGQLLKIMWQISEIDMTNKAVLAEQLTGVDMAYMWQLIKALRDVEPEKINSTYIAEIIERIFE